VAQFTKDVGTAISNVDARMIEQANDAAGRMKEAFKGVASTISVQLAPLVKAFAEDLVSRIKESRTGIMDFIHGISRGFKTILSGPFGFFLDALDSLKFGFDVIRGSFNVLIETMLKGFRKVLELAAKLPDFLGGQQFAGLSDLVFEFESEFGNKADELRRNLEKSLIAPSTREAWSSWVDEADTAITAIQEKARKAAAQSVEGVPKLLARPVEMLIDAVANAKAQTEKATKSRAGAFSSRTSSEIGVSSAALLAGLRIPAFARDNRVEYEQLKELKTQTKTLRDIASNAGGLA